MFGWQASCGSQHHQLWRRRALQFLIQSHMAPSHGPPARTFTPFLPTGSLLHFSKLLIESSASLLHLAFQLPKRCGKGSLKAVLFPQNCMVRTHMGTAPGFKSQQESSSVAPTPTPPTITYTCQHSHIFPAFLGCHSMSGQAWPHGMEPTISKLSCRHCNQGEWPPNYVLSQSHSHLPCSKHGHSYLTYP